MADLINVYSFGTTGSTPIIGDWNGDGKAKIGVFKDGAWRLDSNGNGAWDAGTDKEYSLGATGYIPVTGRWSEKNTPDSFLKTGRFFTVFILF